MHFIYFLYYKYYKFQVKVGNGDVATFTAFLMVILTLFIYDMAIFFFVILLPRDFFSKYLEPPLVMSLILVLFAMYFSFKLYYKSNYKVLLHTYEERYLSTKSHLPWVFPLVGYILLAIGCTLKILQNQGKL